MPRYYFHGMEKRVVCLPELEAKQIDERGYARPSYQTCLTNLPSLCNCLCSVFYPK